MKRALALASLLALGGCATDGYYTGFSSSYGYDDGYAPYYYETYRPYGYDAYPYYYGAPAIGGGVYYQERDRRGGRHRDDDRRRDRRDDRDDGVARAPAERLDPGNMVRPQAPRPAAPAEWLDRNPTSGMTQEESIRSGGR